MPRKRIKRLDSFIDSMRAAYHMAQLCKYSHEKLLSELSRDVWQHEDYKRLTQYERGILEGLRRGLEAESRKHMYFAYDIGGKVQTFDQWRAENPNGDPSTVFNSDNGHHYWNGTTTVY
jgi:hypothetical protein